MGVKLGLSHYGKKILRVYEKWVLRILGSKRKEVVGGRRRPHNEELHSFYGSPNIIRVINSGKMACLRHVARMGEVINTQNIFLGKPERKITQDLGEEWGIILEWILRK
jgi:hypothetical protein